MPTLKYTNNYVQISFSPIFPFAKKSTTTVADCTKSLQSRSIFALKEHIDILTISHIIVRKKDGAFTSTALSIHHIMLISAVS